MVEIKQVAYRKIIKDAETDKALVDEASKHHVVAYDYDIFCPLTRGWCVKQCVSYMRKWYRIDKNDVVKATGAYCSNAMFSGERYSQS